jgi:hypothetical protein
VREIVADSIILTGGVFAERRHPDLWRGYIGLAKDGLSQKQDAGEEKEKGDKAEGGAG